MSSIIVQLMSGETHTLEIFDGYRVVHAKNEMSGILNVNRDLVTISCRQDDGEFVVLDNMDKVEDGENYYAFVGEEQDPPEYYMRFDQSDDVDFEGILFVDEDGNDVDHIQKSSIVHVQLSEFGWQFVRNVLRENRYSQDDSLCKEDVIVSFLNLRNIVDVEIIIDEEEDIMDEE